MPIKYKNHQKHPSPTPNPKDISMHHILHSLNKINIHDQIDRINNVYKNDMKWNYSSNISDILSNKHNTNPKSLILTAYNSGRTADNKLGSSIQLLAQKMWSKYNEIRIRYKASIC